MAWKIAAVAIVLSLAMPLLLSVWSWRTPQLGIDPASLATGEKTLLPCPDSPNCVCSCELRKESAIEPLKLRFEAQEEWQRLQRVCIDELGCRLIEQRENYVRYACVSRWFRFVDDLELLLDEERAVIHVRSASRVGHSDMGVNRQRVERLRTRFNTR